MKARLILENGMIFEGNAFGYLKDSVGEVVFTTGMTGYQEVLTDPSYYGQIVTMTYPLIGNYGINLEDNESDTPKVRGFIVREKCSFPNNFRCEIGLEDYLKQNKIIGLEGIDTRALTKVLRNNGTMRGIISLEHETLEEVKEKGINIAYVTLHVGLGTFRPVKVDDVNEHVMHSEFYHLEEEDAKIINETKKRGNKIISVGTTSTRTLETIGDENGFVKAQSGWTNIFIYPGYKFKVVDKLITNFHLPESTLIMLVSALAGKEKVMNAYNEAVKERYRFFSFGDSMIIK